MDQPISNQLEDIKERLRKIRERLVQPSPPQNRYISKPNKYKASQFSSSDDSDDYARHSSRRHNSKYRVDHKDNSIRHNNKYLTTNYKISSRYLVSSDSDSSGLSSSDSDLEFSPTFKSFYSNLKVNQKNTSFNSRKHQRAVSSKYLPSSSSDELSESDDIYPISKNIHKKVSIYPGLNLSDSDSDSPAPVKPRPNTRRRHHRIEDYDEEESSEEFIPKHKRSRASLKVKNVTPKKHHNNRNLKKYDFQDSSEDEEEENDSSTSDFDFLPKGSLAASNFTQTKFLISSDDSDDSDDLDELLLGLKPSLSQKKVPVTKRHVLINSDSEEEEEIQIKPSKKAKKPTQENISARPKADQSSHPTGTGKLPTKQSVGIPQEKSKLKENDVPQKQAQSTQNPLQYDINDSDEEEEEEEHEFKIFSRNAKLPKIEQQSEEESEIDIKIPPVSKAPQAKNDFSNLNITAEEEEEEEEEIILPQPQKKATLPQQKLDSSDDELDQILNIKKAETQKQPTPITKKPILDDDSSEEESDDSAINELDMKEFLEDRDRKRKQELEISTQNKDSENENEKSKKTEDDNLDEDDDSIQVDQIIKAHAPQANNLTSPPVMTHLDFDLEEEEDSDEEVQDLVRKYLPQNTLDKRKETKNETKEVSMELPPGSPISKVNPPAAKADDPKLTAIKDDVEEEEEEEEFDIEKFIQKHSSAIGKGDFGKQPDHLEEEEEGDEINVEDFINKRTTKKDDETPSYLVPAQEPTVPAPKESDSSLLVPNSENDSSLLIPEKKTNSLEEPEEDSVDDEEIQKIDDFIENSTQQQQQTQTTKIDSTAIPTQNEQPNLISPKVDPVAPPKKDLIQTNDEDEEEEDDFDIEQFLINRQIHLPNANENEDDLIDESPKKKDVSPNLNEEEDDDDDDFDVNEFIRTHQSNANLTPTKTKALSEGMSNEEEED